MGAFAPCAWAQTVLPGEGGAMPPDCPPGAAARAAPAFPLEIYGASGTATLVLDLDRCGVVQQIWIERDSGYTAFDLAAIDAARGWRLTPELHDGVAVPSRVRVPVDFQAPSARQFADYHAKAQIEWDRLWPFLQVPVAAAARDGSLDGYQPDPLSMQPGTAQSLSARVRAEGRPIAGGVLGWPAYQLTESGQRFRWLLTVAGAAAAPALVRQRLVSDGEKSFWASSALCDGDVAACAKWEKQLRRWPRQQPGQPLPKELPVGVPPPDRQPQLRPIGPRPGDAAPASADDAPRPVWRRTPAPADSGRGESEQSRKSTEPS
ncbi:hypothetical protein A7A76_16200 [Lysobacter enzymogenes]|nr:hypothetical protein [Lysobacter enzymogenes]